MRIGASTIGLLLVLAAGSASAQDLFRELGENHADVERFAVEAPNLGEVFIRTVNGDPRAATVA